MNRHKISHYARKLYTLGPKKSVHKITARCYTSLKAHYERYQAYRGTSASTWEAIMIRHGAPDFKSFWMHPSIRAFSTTQDEQNKKFNPFAHIDHTTLITHAKNFVQNRFNLLGSGTQSFSIMPWHTDFRLRQQNPESDARFDPSLFYRDIPISSNDNPEPVKDIKVPWELSRFYHAPILGRAYQHTHDAKYRDAFIYHITDWLEHNPYLLGANWVCAMEVGIRSINWIWAYHYFKDDTSISPEFWQRFTCALYDHMTYLENNWEYYDGITSNHYLSDLVGYLYLCYFFQNLNGMDKKITWVRNEIITEWHKQIFPDGTDYERSTTYHKLVTELLYHALYLCDELNQPLPDELRERFAKMCTFIKQCEYAPGKLIQIGDNDSGTIMHDGLSQEIIAAHAEKEKPLSHHPDFGITIIKANNWHASLRHHAFHGNEPTSHLHNDALSITLAYNGIPIIVDPGSYLYTPSSYWRNQFRSAQSHNTFFVTDHEPTPFDERLFALDVPQQQIKTEPTYKNGVYSVTSSHDLYARFGLRAQRTLDVQNNGITITDEWIAQKKDAFSSTWNFTLHPDIIPIKKNNGWLLTYNNQPLLIFSSELPFECVTAWYSPSYGINVQTNALRVITQYRYRRYCHFFAHH